MSTLTGDRAGRREYRAMALAIAWEMCGRGRAWMLDDLRGAALLGLVEAARTFDAGRGATFRAWARCRVRGAVVDEMRRLLNVRKSGGVRRPVPLEPLPARGDDAPAAGELPVGWELESADEVESLARRLPAKMGEAVLACYLDASTAGARPGRVRFNHSVAIRRLREVS